MMETYKFHSNKYDQLLTNMPPTFKLTPDLITNFIHYVLNDVQNFYFSFPAY